MVNLIAAFEWLWNFRVEQLQQFLQHTESGASSELSKFADWLKSQTDGMTDEEAADVEDHYYDDSAMVRDSTPQLLRYAQYLVIYGAFEHEAAGICRVLHRDGKVKAAPPKNLYLDRVEPYLKKAGFRSSVFGREWKFLNPQSSKIST